MKLTNQYVIKIGVHQLVLTPDEAHELLNELQAMLEPETVNANAMIRQLQTTPGEAVLLKERYKDMTDPVRQASPLDVTYV